MRYVLTKKQIILTVLALVAGLLLFFPVSDSFLGSKIISLEKMTGDFFTSVIPQKIIAPDPLRFFGEAFSSNLTKNGVLLYTNKERVNATIGALKLNTKLNLAAEHKIDDMFAKQFFAHISPEGVGAAELAEETGYDYIAIGENLALGNFKDDKALVDAWMASPGHRANILTKRYEDIGIAVRKGQFEGKTVWLAVQIFGVPASSCTSIDASLKQKIQINKDRLVTLEADLKTKKSTLNSMEPKWGSKYNAKVEEYNNTVNIYNALVKSTKAMITEYNRQVNVYNKCAEGA